MGKTCAKCMITKELDQFYAHKRAPDGRQWWCIACMRHKNKARNRMRKGQRRVRVTVDMAKDHRELLKRFGRDERETISQAVERAVELWLDREVQKEGFSDLHAYMLNEANERENAARVVAARLKVEELLAQTLHKEGEGRKDGESGRVGRSVL